MRSILIAAALTAAATDATAQKFYATPGGPHYAKVMATLTATGAAANDQANTLHAVAGSIEARNACASAGLVFLPSHPDTDAAGCVDPALWGNRCTAIGQAKGGGICVTIGPGAIVAATSDFNATWLDAAAYCASHNAGGFTDWRLPTVSELVAAYQVDGAHPGLSGFEHPHTVSGQDTAGFSNRADGVYKTNTGTIYSANYFKTNVERYRCFRTNN